MTETMDVTTKMESAPGQALTGKIATEGWPPSYWPAPTPRISAWRPGGLLAGLTETVLETVLEAEMTEHLGYEAHDPAGHHSGNSRNGTRKKTVLTDIGPVCLEVSRDRQYASFAPVIVPKRRRRLGGVEQMVCSLSAKCHTHGEISAHQANIYGAKVSKEMISRQSQPPRG